MLEDGGIHDYGLVEDALGLPETDVPEVLPEDGNLSVAAQGAAGGSDVEDLRGLVIVELSVGCRVPLKAVRDLQLDWSLFVSWRRDALDL